MLTIFALLSLLIWVYLTFFNGGYWLASERLLPTPEPERWPSVIAVIPARDEAMSIGPVIASHMATAYPGAFEVVLVDDQSSDGTGQIARAAANDDRPFTLVEGRDRAPGWTGKLWSLQTGLATLAHKPSDYLLLTDADIVHAPGTLTSLVAKAESDERSLVSLMARLDSRGLWGGLLMPAFVFFFQQLYPFPRANDPASSVAASAGGCVLIKREIFEAAGGVEAIKGEIIDDCALARTIKQADPKHRIWIGLAGDEVVSLRDNRPLSSVWTMVERSAFVQLNKSYVMLAGSAIGLLLMYLAPLMAIALGGTMAVLLGLTSIFVMAASYLPTLKLYDQASWKAFGVPVAGLLYLAMTLSSGWQAFRGNAAKWKGRTYNDL